MNDVQPDRKDVYRILIVDDEEMIRRLLEDLLSQEPEYDVYTAADGVEAQELLQAKDFDVVVTDLTMPRMGGLPLMQWAIENRPEPEWIILSGRATVEDAVEAVHLGAYDFIRKPLDLVDSLKVTVRNALQKKRLTEDKEKLYCSLAEQFETLTNQYRLTKAQKETIEQDLRRAELIQRALLPYAPPHMGMYTIDASYRPSHNVGGDLYEVVRINDRHILIYIADAAGHGVSAAMLAVLFKHRIAVLDDEYLPRSPRDILASVNEAILTECSAPGLFITAAVGMLDLDTRVLEIASAGHPPLLVHHADGRHEMVYHTGPALGIMPNAEFAQMRVELNENDRILLYTDGLFEAKDPKNALTVEEIEVELGRGDLCGQDLLHRLEELASQRREDEERQDDITMVLLRSSPGASTLDNGEPEPIDVTKASELSPQAQVLEGENGNCVFFAIEGRANWTFCSAFHDECQGRIQDHKDLVIDMSMCTHLDSTFLGTIQETVSSGGANGVGVVLQGVLPEVRSLFEELGMQTVLDSICEQVKPLPGHMMTISRAEPLGQLADARRMLQAHKALVALSEKNREEFINLIKGLEHEVRMLEQTKAG